MCVIPSLANDNLSGHRSADRARGAARGASAPLHVPIAVHPGHDRLDHVARAERDRLDADRRRARARLRRRRRRRSRYKRSRRGDARIDRAAEYVLSGHGRRLASIDFVPWGWDERQFNSPGFDLPVGSPQPLARGRVSPSTTRRRTTSASSMPEQLEDALDAVLEILDVFEADRRYVNLAPKGEPQLGKRGLYPSHRRRGGGGRAARDALGAEPVGRRRSRCSTSPSGPASSSSSCARRRTGLREAGLLGRRGVVT